MTKAGGEGTSITRQQIKRKTKRGEEIRILEQSDHGEDISDPRQAVESPLISLDKFSSKVTGDSVTGPKLKPKS